MKSLVWSAASYGCESWTLKKHDEARLMAFKMKGLRQIMRVSWTVKKTNLWVLQQAGVERSLVQSIKQRKLKYCGHMLRKQEESLEKDIMEGTMPGTRRRGRPRISWRDNIGDWTGMSMKEVLSSVQDHDRWRRAVHNATKLRSEDG